MLYYLGSIHLEEIAEDPNERDRVRGAAVWLMFDWWDVTPGNRRVAWSYSRYLTNGQLESFLSMDLRSSDAAIRWAAISAHKHDQRVFDYVFGGDAKPWNREPLVDIGRDIVRRNPNYRALTADKRILLMKRVNRGEVYDSALRDPDPNVRAWGVQRASDIRGVRRLLADNSASVRAAAVLRVADPKAAARALTGQAPIVRQAAVEVSTDARAVRRMVDDTNADVKKQALKRLVELGPEKARAELVDLLKHTDPNVRIQALQTLKDPTVALGALDDGDPHVRAAALAATDDSAPVPRIAVLLKDPEPAVRSAAVIRLNRMRNSSASEVPTAHGFLAVNPKDGAEMVYVPAGEFIMGSDHGWVDVRPQRKVYLDGYWMYKHEVTVAQYRKFCSETGRWMPEPPSWGWKEDHPIVNVSWHDAKAYADWAGVQLPTEAQWEKAARGTDGRGYPWGSKYDPSKALCFDDDFIWCTLPVGLFPESASPYDCRDMTGSVSQWCADWYEEDYYVRAPYRNPTGPQTGSWHSVRGAPWGISHPDGFRCACRRPGGCTSSSASAISPASAA